MVAPCDERECCARYRMPRRAPSVAQQSSCRMGAGAWWRARTAAWTLAWRRRWRWARWRCTAGAALAAATTAATLASRRPRPQRHARWRLRALTEVTAVAHGRLKGFPMQQVLPGLFGVDPDAQERAAASMGLNYGAYAVRLSGQDCERGTFNHRNAVLYDQRSGARHASFAATTMSLRAPAKLALLVPCLSGLHCLLK